MHAESAVAVDMSGMLAPKAAARTVTVDEVRALAPKLGELVPRLEGWRHAEPFSFFTLPFATDAAAIQQRARDLAQRFRQTIVFGIGGSSLGGEMLACILGASAHPVQFFDNVDPTTLARLDAVDWRDTLLLVVSKSGNTAETLSQLLTVLPAIERSAGATPLRERILVITENRDGALFRIAQDLGLEVLPHPAVGGRYSVLSIVGLLPAALAGVDIAAVLSGARRMAERCLTGDLNHNPAFWHGAIQYLHAQRGRTLSVQMIYADRLRTLVDWFRQLWAESLGKHNAGGEACGLTPVSAFGVTDQHSQLQLYLDGPDDKQFTLVTDPGLRAQGLRIDARFAHLPEVAPLAGHTTGELFHAEFEATRTTLERHHRPVRRLTFAAGDAVAIGEYIMLMEVETIAVAHLFGIDPFDQPAVEEGKILAREFLAR
jgi:glucose-6-phosphate isomerase